MGRSRQLFPIGMSQLIESDLIYHVQARFQSEHIYAGGQFNAAQNYSMAHRQRLVDLAKDKPHMDIKFTAFIQCSTVCDEMEQHYGEHGKLTCGSSETHCKSRSSSTDSHIMSFRHRFQAS